MKCINKFMKHIFSGGIYRNNNIESRNYFSVMKMFNEKMLKWKYNFYNENVKMKI